MISGRKGIYTVLHIFTLQEKIGYEVLWFKVLEDDEAVGRNGTQRPLCETTAAKDFVGRGEGWGEGNQRTESRNQRAESREQRAENGGQKAESRERKFENRKQRAESREQKSESREQKAESRKQRTENGERRTEGRKRKSRYRKLVFIFGVPAVASAVIFIT